MTELNETPLPGVGVRHDFVSRSGRPLGVVSHHTGRRDLVVYDRADPDRAVVTVELNERESHTLAELLGGSRIVERMEELPHRIAGLVIDWLRVDAASPLADRTLAEAEVRTRTGASVMAIVRGELEVPAPGGDDRLLRGDTVVVVGTPESVATLTELVEGPGPG